MARAQGVRSTKDRKPIFKPWSQCEVSIKIKIKIYDILFFFNKLK